MLKFITKNHFKEILDSRFSNEGKETLYDFLNTSYGDIYHISEIAVYDLFTEYKDIEEYNKINNTNHELPDEISNKVIYIKETQRFIVHNSHE